MYKKLTISIDEDVHKGLHAVVGKGAISQFIEDLLPSHVVKNELDAAYKLMAEDEEPEADALAWSDRFSSNSSFTAMPQITFSHDLLQMQDKL